MLLSWAAAALLAVGTPAHAGRVAGSPATIRAVAPVQSRQAAALQHPALPSAKPSEGLVHLRPIAQLPAGASPALSPARSAAPGQPTAGAAPQPARRSERTALRRAPQPLRAIQETPVRNGLIVLRRQLAPEESGKPFPVDVFQADLNLNTFFAGSAENPSAAERELLRGAASQKDLPAAWQLRKAPGARQIEATSALNPARRTYSKELAEAYTAVGNAKVLTGAIGIFSTLFSLFVLGCMPFIDPRQIKDPLLFGQYALILATAAFIFSQGFLFWRRKLSEISDLDGYRAQSPRQLNDRIRLLSKARIVNYVVLAHLLMAQLVLLALTPAWLPAVMFLYTLGEGVHYNLYKIQDFQSHKSSIGGVFGQEIRRLRTLLRRASRA